MELRRCLVCNGEIAKKSHESVNRYNSKKFCSQVCTKKYFRDNKIGWFNPEVSKVQNGRHKRKWWDALDGEPGPYIGEEDEV